MKTALALTVALAGAVALFIYSRTSRGETVIANTIDSTLSAVRGIRNKNPGNIRRGQAWQGLAPVQTDSAFDQFVSMPYGVRALVITLRTYQSKHGLRTIRAMIARWAPPSENRTDDYVDFVAREVGVQPDYEVDMMNADTAFYMTRAIMAQECGIGASLLVSDADVRAGIKMAS